MRDTNSVYNPIVCTNQAQFDTVPSHDGVNWRQSHRQHPSHGPGTRVGVVGGRSGSPGSSSPGSPRGRGLRQAGGEKNHHYGSRSPVSASNVADGTYSCSGRGVLRPHASRDGQVLTISVHPDSGGGARRGANTEYWSDRESRRRGRNNSRDRDSNNHGRHGGRKNQDDAGRENQGYEGDPPETPHDYGDDYATSEGSGDGGEDPRDRSRGSRRSGSARSDIQVFRKFRLKVQEIVNYFSTDWQRDDKDIRVAYCKQGEQCYKQ